MNLFNPFITMFGFGDKGTRVKDIPYGVKHDKLVPKGCKRYYFNNSGQFQFTRSMGYNLEIIALNDKNAMRKFKRIMSNIVKPCS